MSRYEHVYRSTKTGPDPFMEFCLGWLHRNPPRSQGREAVDRLGLRPVPQPRRPHQRRARRRDRPHRRPDDGPRRLAHARHHRRLRHVPRALRPLRGALRHAPIDLDALMRHHFAFTLTNQLAVGQALRVPNADTDLMTNMQWCYETNLFATEALAEILDVELPDGRRAGARAHPGHDPGRPPGRGAAHPLDRARRGRRRVPPLPAADAVPDGPPRRPGADEIGDAARRTPTSTTCTSCSATGPTTGSTGEAELERFVLADADHRRPRRGRCSCSSTAATCGPTPCSARPARRWPPTSRSRPSADACPAVRRRGSGTSPVRTRRTDGRAVRGLSRG